MVKECAAERSLRRKGEKSLILIFKKEKETKNTVKYTEVEQDGWVKVGSLYIQKAAVAQEKLGDTIVVEIRAQE